MMQSDSRFFVIAGTARNVGKTTLACELIKKLSKTERIIAVKFLCLKKEGYKHKHHNNIDTYEIFEERDLQKKKDSTKMLVAGATKSFFIVSQEEYINQAIVQLLKLIRDDDVVVAESACLRKYINPKYFIIVDKENAEPRKDYIDNLIPLANYYLDSDKDFMFESFLSTTIP